MSDHENDPDVDIRPRPQFRAPDARDGLAIHRIVVDSGVLDVNSEYCYVLFAAEFGRSCVLCEVDGEPAGFVTGFVRPEEPSTYFLWQVGVDDRFRGQGIAAKMIHHVLDRLAPEVVRLQTTVSPSNEASLRTFASIARARGWSMNPTGAFTSEHLGAGHEREDLYTLS